MRMPIRFSLVVAALALSAACKKPPSEAAAKEEVARAVETQPVESGELVRSLEAIGNLEGEEEVNVFSLVAERIVSLRVKEGQGVRRGQVLAIVSSAMQTDSVNQAQAALALAEANRDVQVDQVERTRKLVEVGGAPRSQLETLERQLAAADAQVRQIATQVAAASTQKSRAVVTAPIDGTVARLNVKEGDLATPSQPLLTLVKSEVVKAVFQLPEREFLQVDTGTLVDVELLGRPEVRARAEITLKGAAIDRMSRTGKVEVRLANEDGRFLSGAAVRGRFELERKPDVVLVPAKALLFTANTERTGEAIAFVVTGGIAKRRDVVIGGRQGGDTEVRSGLAPGEELVVLGQHLLQDGAKVRVAAKAKPEPQRTADEKKAVDEKKSAAAAPAAGAASHQEVVQ